jgi:hypothetical protein
MQMIINIFLTAIAIVSLPVIVRFVLWRKPINQGWIRLLLSLAFYIPNLMFISYLGRSSALNFSIFAGIWVCYEILRYKNKAQRIEDALKERKNLGYD